MKYGELNLGQVEAIVNKLGGMDRVHRLLKDELVVVERSNVRFKIFKTIKLGTIELTREYAGENFRRMLNKTKNFFHSGVGAILNSQDFINSVAKNKTEVKLVVVSTRELEPEPFEGKIQRSSIYQQAQKFGLKLCPAEVGPQLRLQYLEQPAGESLIIASEPLRYCQGDDFDGFLFYVRRVDKQRELSISKESYHDESDRWVFMQS